jgi:prevent-host-death family protein
MNKVTRTVSAREANQQFSQLLAAVERGEEVTITKHGAAVARMIGIVADVPGDAAAEREGALARVRALMHAGLRHGGQRFTRDEMHEP